MTYPGGKGGNGVYQKIINLIPPHDVYIETHLGGGAIIHYKKPANVNIGIDIDPEVTNKWLSCSTTKNGDNTGFTIINDDAARWLSSHNFTGSEFVYIDPPYLMETRKSGKLYNFEYSDDDHIQLLEIARKIPCMVMISGYYSSLYMSMLQGWNVLNFQAQTRQGLATEYLWFNYPEPSILHDYSFLGDDFRERERIRKKRERWVNRLLKMPELERNAILSALLKNTTNPAPSETMMTAVTVRNDVKDFIIKNGDEGSI